MTEQKEDAFLKKLKALSINKNKDEQEVDYGKAIRCLNPDHEDKNPSMVIFKTRALCKSCGYCIPNSDKAKPYKANLKDIIIQRAIKLCKENFPSEFVSERKYNKEIIKSLGLGFFSTQVFTDLQEEWGLKNITKAGLMKDKKCYFIGKTIIPVSEFHFTGKPSKVSIFGNKKQPYIINGEEPLILCEGETDAIALKHIYPKNKIMALCGVQSQKPLEEIYENDIWICFDNDDAGKKGIFDATSKLKGKELKQLCFPKKYKDIDELWRENQGNSFTLITTEEIESKDVFIDNDFEPITKPEYKVIIDENFPNLWETIDLCLSLVTIHKIKKWTDPVNVNLVGAPSSQKTTAASFFYAIPNLTIKSDSFTPKSFVSHSVTVTDEELEEIDLLPKIKDMCFITPELAPLFAKRKEDLIEVIGILTRVFDGEGIETDSGAKGHRGYVGEYLFTMIGATTPLPKTAWNIMGRMGSRMFFYQVPDDNPEDEELQMIISSPKSYGDKIKECKEATLRMVQTIFKDGLKRNIVKDEAKNDVLASKVIINCAKLLCRLRASINIWNDDFNNDVVYESPLIEKPYRIVNILYNLAIGHAITENRNYITLDDVVFMPRITASTMPEDRVNAFKLLLSDVNKKWGITEIAEILNTSEKIARKTMKTLEVLDIISIEEVMMDFNSGSTRRKIYSLLPEVRKWILDINSIMVEKLGTFPISTSVSAAGTFYKPLKASKLKLKEKKAFSKSELTLVENGKVPEEQILEGDGKVPTKPKEDLLIEKILHHPEKNAELLESEFGQDYMKQKMKEGIVYLKRGVDYGIL